MAKVSSEKINWTPGLIVETFGLKEQFDGFKLLQEWLTVNADELTTDDNFFLETRRKQLIKYVQGWNAETLKMRFIAFILDRADYDMGKFQGVFEAEISAEVDSYFLKVIPDFAVARVTKDLVQNPYFYFHEYKSKGKKSKDPMGQILLAMLISQILNKDDKPIYGCYVYGEDWHFMVLHKKEFAVATAFNATKMEDLQKILLVLRKFKHILLTELVNENTIIFPSN